MSTDPLVAELTPAQFRVARALLHDGATNDRLATRLRLAPDTVRSHLKDIYLATATGTRTEFVVAVLRRRVVLQERAS